MTPSCSSRAIRARSIDTARERRSLMLEGFEFRELESDLFTPSPTLQFPEEGSSAGPLPRSQHSPITIEQSEHSAQYGLHRLSKPAFRMRLANDAGDGRSVGAKLVLLFSHVSHQAGGDHHCQGLHHQPVEVGYRQLFNI